jgi:hypothetical protein
MSHTQARATRAIDLGAATRQTKGSVPGMQPDGIQPIRYAGVGLTAD